MQMAHPIHLHGSPFQIVERSVSSAYQAHFDTVKDGLVESGWKDTFLLMPGERVKILTKPQHYTGRFLYHCHNLEHEDMGMMRNYDVV
jgi:FtsP/CotA-like multicopper oxidase with cupredoxin domain